MGERIKIKKPQGADRIIVESGGAIRIQPGGVISIGAGTPINAEAATVTLAADDLAILANGDIVSFAGISGEKAASADEGKWNNATALAGLLNTADGWGAAVNAGAVVITAATRGAAYNGEVVTIEKLEDTTAGGDGDGAEAEATIAAATIARLANGDIVSFAGAVFIKAADTNTATGEFEDQAGLIACIGDMDDWAAADNNGAIDITAATDSVDFNDIDIVVSLYRVTADGVDGTVGRAGDMYADETYLYVASQDNGIGDTNWRRIALGNAYYPD